MVVVVSIIVVPVTTGKSTLLVVFPPLRTVEVQPVVRVAAAHCNAILDNEILERASVLTLISTDRHIVI